MLTLRSFLFFLGLKTSFASPEPFHPHDRGRSGTECSRQLRWHQSVQDHLFEYHASTIVLRLVPTTCQ